MKVKLTLRKMGESWWIHGLEEPMGPYRKREDAELDRRGVKRFFEDPDLVVTVCPGSGHKTRAIEWNAGWNV